jgi:hypothetical protein
MTGDCLPGPGSESDVQCPVGLPPRAAHDGKLGPSLRRDPDRATVGGRLQPSVTREFSQQCRAKVSCEVATAVETHRMNGRRPIRLFQQYVVPFQMACPVRSQGQVPGVENPCRLNRSKHASLSEIAHEPASKGASEMVVIDSRLPQCLGSTALTKRLNPLNGGGCFQQFNEVSCLLPAEAVVPVSASKLDGDKPRLFEFPEVTAGGGRSDMCFCGELLGWEGPTIQECQEHFASGAVADEGANDGQSSASGFERVRPLMMVVIVATPDVQDCFHRLHSRTQDRHYAM